MSFGLNEEQLQRMDERQRALERHYNAINAAHTRIIQGGGVEHYVGTLQIVLLPDEFQRLQRIVHDSAQVRDLLWAMIMEMSEDP